MSLHTLWGLGSQAILLAWLSTKLLWRIQSRPRLAIAATVAAISLLPIFNGISAAMVVRGLFGDPSVTTIQLILIALAGRSTGIDRRAQLGLGLFGLVFYPLALGISDFDPYRFGYSPWPIVLILGFSAVLAWWRGSPVYLWLLSIDLAAFAVELHESTNFWDVLFDPLLVIYSLAKGIATKR